MTTATTTTKTEATNTVRVTVQCEGVGETEHNNCMPSAPVGLLTYAAIATMGLMGLDKSKLWALSKDGEVLNEDSPIGESADGGECALELVEREDDMTTTTTTIFHIRRRLARVGLHQRDPGRVRDRHTETFCEAPVTEYDVPWNHKAPSWTKRDGTQMEPCARCLHKREDMGGNALRRITRAR